MDSHDRATSKNAAGATGNKPQTPNITSLKPGELPNVLRTSADVGSKFPGVGSHVTAGTKQDAQKQGAGTKGLPLASTDLLSTALLPRLDPSSAQHNALPSHPAKSASPPRPGRTSVTPERFRSKPPDALHSSSDLSPAAAAARRPVVTGNSSKPTPDAPIVGSVAMAALPAAYYRKLGASEPDASWLAGATVYATTTSPPAHSGSPHQQHVSALISPQHGTAASSAAPAAGEDVLLLRPVDPGKPGYYWKPVKADASSSGGQVAQSSSEILGYQLLQEVAGADGMSAPTSHTRQRMSMLLRLPLGTEHFLEAIPAAIQDRAGHACLLVLPSDKPSNRKEAVAVEALLTQMLQEPGSAVVKSCQWRAATLAELCNESLGAVAEALKEKGPPKSWQFKQQHVAMTGHVLGSGMVEALDCLTTAVDVSTTAVKMASLINTKTSAVEVGAAAVAVTEATAAAVAPASLKQPSPFSQSSMSGVAVAAAAEVAEAAVRAAQEQQLQRVQQQQQQKISLRHQLQLQALTGEVSTDQSGASPCNSSRSNVLMSSRSHRVDSDTAAGVLHSNSISQMHNQLSPVPGSPTCSTGGASSSRQSPLRQTVHQDAEAALFSSTAADSITTTTAAADAGADADRPCSSSKGTNPAIKELKVVTDMQSSKRQSTRASLPSSPTKASPSKALQHSAPSARHSTAEPGAAPETASTEQQQQPGGDQLPSTPHVGSSSPDKSKPSPRRCISPGSVSTTRRSDASSLSLRPSSPLAPVSASFGTPRSPRLAGAGCVPDSCRARCKSPNSRLSSAAGAAEVLPLGATGLECSLSPKRQQSPDPEQTARLASNSGSGTSAQQQCQSSTLTLLPTSADGSTTAEETTESGGLVELRHNPGQELSSLYGLALAAAICMADLVRQVEVACVERGRAMVYAWNCSMGAAESVLVELKTQNKQLLTLNKKLVDEQQEMSKEFKGVEFLRREAMRFRKEHEVAQATVAATTADNTTLKTRLEIAEGQVQSIEAHVRKRLAKLRWHNAFAVLGTWSRQSTIQSGGVKGKGPGQLLAKVIMLEKMVNAVNSVEHRKMAWGRNQKMENFDCNRPQMSDMVQVVTTGPQVVAPGRVHDGFNIDSTVQMFSALTPEARTMVLATIPPVQRWKIVEAMKDEDRAGMVIAMSVGLRKEAAAAVDARLWERTMDIIKNHSMHAARYLTSMDIDDAAAEFLTWNSFQQIDVLSSLDVFTAAGLLTRTPENTRKELLSMMEPYLAANIVQAMMPPPAAQSVDALDVKKAMAILAAMDPNKAADVLTELGAPKAASKLMHMDPDARNCIIESMAPRAAANMLGAMEDALQEEQQLAESPDSPELLSLHGGMMESPVMDTMMELNAENAYSIMSYMTVQDKAALLANMDPEAVARLLGLMDPHEAVLLLSALGDGNSKLVSQALRSEDRDRMIQILQEAECTPAGMKGKKAHKKGSFRDKEQDTVQRLVHAYEKIEAGAMNDAEEDIPEAPTPPVRSQRTTRSQYVSKPDTKSIGVQVGGGLETALSATDAAAATADESVAASRMGSRQRTASSVGFLDDLPEETDESEVTATTAATSRVAVNKAPRAKANAGAAAAGAASETKKVPLNSRRAEERAMSTTLAAPDTEAAAETAAEVAADVPQTAKKNTKATNKLANAAAPGGSSGGVNKSSRKTATGSDESATEACKPAVSQRTSQIGVLPPEAPVPKLPLAANDGSGSLEEAPLSTCRHARLAEEDAGDGQPASVDTTPRVEATAGAVTSRKSVRPAAVGAAAGRKALKEALKTHAAAKKPAAVKDTKPAAAAAGTSATVGSLMKEPSQLAGNLAEEDAPTDSPSAPPALPEAPAQSRLGKLPKNARLIEAMGQHKNAKPKPKGWLMAVVDSVYKDGETLLRKLGRADMIKKQSVPEIVFAYFHNKYGQRALVNENVGSLVNTLALYQRTDLRLEAFARLLSEEWDVSIFLDFLTAQSMCIQPTKLVCIEYPREASKDEQYAWVCLYKAVWVADSMLGMRSQAARNRFNEFLHMASVPAEDADVERLRRERREAAAKDAKQTPQEELPDSFYKLPRIRFLLILCKEILRINKFIASFGEEKFVAMDAQRSGTANIVLVRSFVKSMSPNATDAQVSDNINMFVSTAEGFIKDIPPEQVLVQSVTELSKDAFVAGVTGTPVIREHIKLNLVPPARLEEDGAEAQVFFSLLTVLTMRHSSAMLAYWQQALDAVGDRGRALQQQIAAVTAAGSAGDARLKSYVSLLLGLINTATQTYLDSLLGSDADANALASDQLEDGLVRLEDTALILVSGCPYLLDEDSQLAMARMARLPSSSRIQAMGRQLLQHRRMEETAMGNAANVLQRMWRRRQLLISATQQQEEQQPDAEQEAVQAA